MFTNAGMNQFKDIFLEFETPKEIRIANTQKCLRVSGKHNDLEEVGVDTYHHTMFEMLGNWSFGDYFKKEAIEWAWELFTEVYKINSAQLYVTVFDGDKKDNTEFDEESYNLWKGLIEEERILRCSKKDNFWEMGAQGPCGPSSEIHIDIRPEAERAKIPGKELVNKDHPQVIELWNLVFMEYNRNANGKLTPLKNKHVDTGMGLERLVMVLQGKKSNYDSDIFSNLINKLESHSGHKYLPNNPSKEQEKINIAFRVIVDHVRAVAFSIADGQLPSNTGAGYVIRRILRRAIRYGYQFLNLEEPFLNLLLDDLAEDFIGVFDELTGQKDFIQKIIFEEESSFFRTLSSGIKRMNEIIDSQKSENNNLVPGKLSFELYDTYGFPLDLTKLIAAENKFSVDEEGFNKALKQQKTRSKADAERELGDWIVLKEDDVQEFIGYDHVSTVVRIMQYREVNIKKKRSFQLIFNLTPFYPEGGGQVGDTGWITSNSEKIEIQDTKRENGVIIHNVDQLPKNLEASFNAQVDEGKREKTAKNHSATHLLHHALREVLGSHVEQKGSLVNDNYLRFDFSHFSKLSNQEIQIIEQKINYKIRDNISLNEHRKLDISKAKEMGAMALFGEKYGETVRVVQFGDSIELCGGIHVNHTGEIGLFKLISEGAVASGIRRIEAITSSKALQFYEKQFQENNQLKSLVKNSDLLKGVSQLIDENQKLKKQIEKLSSQKAGSLKNDLLNKSVEINGIKFIGSEIELDNKSIKNLAFELTKMEDNLVLVLATKELDKATLTVAISKSLVEQKDLHAGNIIRDISKEINGGGGGQAFYATAGGKNPSGIKNALKRAYDFLA